MFRLVSMTNASGLSEAGQMAAPDLPIFFTNRLHLAGRPQMSTRPFWGTVISLRQNASSRTIVSKAL